MSKNNKNTSDLVVGALVGGLIGSAAALFFTPTSGKELRGHIEDAYNELGHSISNSITGEEETSNSALMWGSLAAGVVAGAALLMTTKQGEGLRQGIVDTYDNLSDKTAEYVGNGSRLRNLVAKHATGSRRNKKQHHAQTSRRDK